MCFIWCIFWVVTICKQLFVLQSSSHSGTECSQFMGWALAHKGKASEVTYNPDDPPSAYSKPSVHARINMYTEAGR